MRFIQLLLLPFVGLLLLTGCTSTEVISNKDPNFHRQIDNLYVASRVSESLDAYETSALDALARTFGGQSLKVLATADPLPGEDASSEDIEAASVIPFEKARTNGMTTLLVIEERDQDASSVGGPPVMGANGMWMGGGAGVKQVYSLNASLYDVESEKRVWRAEIESKGEEYSTQSKEGRVMAESLMAKFVEDGLLPANFNADSKAFK